MNHEHPNIKFTFEVEKNNNFSDVKVCRENHKFTTTINLLILVVFLRIYMKLT